MSMFLFLKLLSPSIFDIHKSDNFFFVPVERVRHIQESLEHFIEALNSEKWMKHIIIKSWRR